LTIAACFFTIYHKIILDIEKDNMNNSPTESLQPINLPDPVFERQGTLFEALKARRTSRSYSNKKIPLQVLADILWAAQGVNRLKGIFGGQGRTAGSASNSQEIYVYVAMEEGIYLYEPVAHRIAPVVAGDFRALAIGAGQMGAGANAPVRLIYVVDMDKLKHAPFQEPGLYNPEVQKSYYFVDTGLIAQNVYLAASSSGLASWFHNCDRDRIASVLMLKPHQRALFGHTIGYSAD
jgi:nitroreductase